MMKVIESLTSKVMQGDGPSCLRLGRLYYVGQGVERNVRTAMALYYSAELSGDVDTLRELGRMFLEGDFAPADVRRAAQIYRKAADMGDPYSQLALGRMYQEGTGVEYSSEKAWEYISAAARGGMA
ncbi:tetratricopeptide repeat protein [Methanomethylophilus alvi]|uniref:tetratricopeptide repeat protein n=1 Tax=Methanomethylophilus alvi TaxID=1291540 RepID=UPI0037DD6283